MEVITLYDGTVVKGHCIETDTELFVYLDGLTVAEGVALFSSPEKTERITEMNHGNEHVYIGYTDIYAASHEYGNCNLVMRKAKSNA